MTWIVSLGRQDVDDWEEKSACWLEGNVYLNKKKKCGCVSKNHQGNRTEF